VKLHLDANPIKVIRGRTFAQSLQQAGGFFCTLHHCSHSLSLSFPKSPEPTDKRRVTLHADPPPAPPPPPAVRASPGARPPALLRLPPALGPSNLCEFACKRGHPPPAPNRSALPRSPLCGRGDPAAAPRGCFLGKGREVHPPEKGAAAAEGACVPLHHANPRSCTDRASPKRAFRGCGVPVWGVSACPPAGRRGSSLAPRCPSTSALGSFVASRRVKPAPGSRPAERCRGERPRRPSAALPTFLQEVQARPRTLNSGNRRRALLFN